MTGRPRKKRRWTQYCTFVVSSEVVTGDDLILNNVIRSFRRWAAEIPDLGIRARITNVSECDRELQKVMWGQLGDHHCYEIWTPNKADDMGVPLEQLLLLGDNGIKSDFAVVWSNCWNGGPGNELVNRVIAKAEELGIVCFNTFTAYGNEAWRRWSLKIQDPDSPKGKRYTDYHSRLSDGTRRKKSKGSQSAIR